LLERHTGRRRLREHDGHRDDPLQSSVVLGHARVHLLKRRDCAPRIRPRLPRPRGYQLGRCDQPVSLTMRSEIVTSSAKS
jgi:hypothetical protein